MHDGSNHMNLHSKYTDKDYNIFKRGKETGKTTPEVITLYDFTKYNENADPSCIWQAFHLGRFRSDFWRHEQSL